MKTIVFCTKCRLIWEGCGIPGFDHLPTGLCWPRSNIPRMRAPQVNGRVYKNQPVIRRSRRWCKLSDSLQYPRIFAICLRLLRPRFSGGSGDVGDCGGSGVSCDILQNLQVVFSLSVAFALAFPRGAPDPPAIFGGAPPPRAHP